MVDGLVQVLGRAEDGEIWKEGGRPKKNLSENPKHKDGLKHIIPLSLCLCLCHIIPLSPFVTAIRVLDK